MQLALEARPGGFAVGLTVLDVAVVVRVDGAILRPLLPGTTEPDPRATSLDVVLGSATLRLATERPVEVEFTGAAAVPRCMIGATGIIASAGGLRWLTPGSEGLPGGTPADFAGLHLQDVVLELASLELAPDAELRIDSAFVGRGGVTADVALEGLDLAGSLAGFAFTLDSLDLTVVQNGVTGSAVAGTLQVPFFEQPVDVAVSLSGDGGLHVSLAGQGPDGLAELAVPGLGTLGLTGLGLDVSDGDAQLLLSGRLEVTAGAPTLQWPIVALRDLGVDTAGHVTLAGGWLVLQEPLALDLYGFGIEITRVGFGTEEDGRRWFGVDGAVRLTELLPAGASARGLRVTWDPDRPAALPQLTLDGIGVTFGVPDAFGFTGEVALADDPNGDGKLFTGRARARPRRARRRDRRGHHDRPRRGRHVRVRRISALRCRSPWQRRADLSASRACPMNMAPLVATAPSMRMARRSSGATGMAGTSTFPQPFSVTDPTKWSPSIGSWAFGAGLSLGTLPDAGFSVNTKALLVVLMPGPVILLQGTADLLKVPAAFRDGATDEGTFGLLAASASRAATLELGIDALGASRASSTSRPPPTRSLTSTGATPGTSGSGATSRRAFGSVPTQTCQASRRSKSKNASVEAVMFEDARDAPRGIDAELEGRGAAVEGRQQPEGRPLAEGSQNFRRSAVPWSRITVAGHQHDERRFRVHAEPGVGNVPRLDRRQTPGSDARRPSSSGR